MAGPGAFISVGRSLESAVARAAKADELGFDSVYTTHIAGHDSLTVLAAYAGATKRVQLGTGVLPALSRTPVATAQQAATVDEMSGSRLVLGIGVSHQVTVENWFGGTISKPVAQMREYLLTLRAAFRGEDPPQGVYYSSRFRFMGLAPRADLPIYVAGLSPNMLRMAGEHADGTVLWLCNPDYIRDAVVPAVREGRERAGKGLDGFDIVAAVPAAVTEDRDAAYATMRQDLVTYMSLPFYRRMLERSGFGEEIAGFDAGVERGEMESAKGAISDRLLDALTGIGAPGDVRGAVGRYLEAGATSPCVGAVPRTDFEATLEAVSELL